MSTPHEELQAAYVRIAQSWREVEALWTDDYRARFEAEFWGPLESGTQRHIQLMQQIEAAAVRANEESP